MARLPRLALAGHLHHVLQRGHNRQPICNDDADLAHLRNLIAEHARARHVAVHAYVLMPNHFHLLVTPADADGLPALMQAVGRAYVRHFNQRSGRSGTLWDGRYRSTLVQPETGLLPHMAYIDLNPVRAHLASAASHFPWSSHRHYIGLGTDRLITPHPLFWQLGNTPFAREQAYAERVAAGLTQAELRRIADALVYGWADGDAAFIAAAEALSGRRLARGRAGRPRRISSVPD